MIDIIQEYWKSLLWTDGYRFTGVAITLWLLISSVVIGGNERYVSVCRKHYKEALSEGSLTAVQNKQRSC